MIRKIPTLVVLAATVATGDVATGEPTWTVPANHPALRIQVEGTVEISRFSVQTIRSGSPDAIVSWIGPDGRHAEFGDELMRFDSQGLAQAHQNLSEEMEVRRQVLTNQITVLARTVANEEETIERLREDLEVMEAAARTAARPDPSRVATLKRQIDLARREAVLQDKERARLENLFRLGELAAHTLEDAELAAGAARRQVRIAELALEDAGDGSDPVVARRSAWQAERIRAALGLDENGELDETRGHGRKLAGYRARLERQRDTYHQEVGALEVERQAVARATWPHLPLKVLRVTGPDGTTWTWEASDPDATAPYDSHRGHGWLEPPRLAPSHEALVVRGEARWRRDLPPGEYDLEFVLGDAVEWNCFFVRTGERVLLADNRLEPDQVRSYRANGVHVGEEDLVLDIGLPHKAILAPQAGAVKNQTWLSLGRAVHNNPPALYLTPTAQLVVRSRIHHLQVPFFEPSGKTAVHRIELQDHTGRWITGGRVMLNEDPIAFFPGEHANHRGREEDRAEERTAREVVVVVPPEFAENFPVSGHAAIRVETVSTNGAVIVPAYLVHEGDDGLFVQRDGRLAPITGVRYDQHVLVTEGVAPGDPLTPPRSVDSANGANRYTGEVVSGGAVPMVVPTRSWARIESLVPHGSLVQEGELVVTLYRPSENEHAVKAQAKAVAAETRFLEAVESRNNAFLDETIRHATALQEEKIAADQVAENRRIDLSVLASADESEVAATKELALVEERVRKLEGVEAARLDYEDLRRRRDVLRLQARSRALDRVSTFRQVDFTRILDDRFEWQQSRRELALRESKLALNVRQQEVMSQQARTLLENDMEDRDRGHDFESMRRMHAPATGNVFFLKGYNDLAKRNERIDKEFVVWNGLTIAEILDLDNLSFRVSLPERHYHAVAEGMQLPIELEDLDDRTLTGTVSTKGRSLYTPRRGNSGEREAIRIARVFDVTLTFPVPADLQDRLRPGLRGTVTLP